MMMVLFGTVCTINAQTAYEKAKFFDNWSAGVTAGISSPLALDRAQAVKDALVKAGISADRISVTSDYASQRRATIVVEK